MTHSKIRTMDETKLKALLGEITREYESSLIIPNKKLNHQFLLCPVGLVGAGKTTVVKPLSEQLSLVRISGDEIRKILKEKNLDYELRWKVAKPLAAKYLDDGYSLCIDSDCASRETQELIQQVEAKYKLKIVWIHINPPEDFIIKKLSTHEGGWMGNEALIKNYYERKPLHENLNFPFVYTFDTSKKDLPRQIDEAAKVIQKVTNN